MPNRIPCIIIVDDEKDEPTSCVNLIRRELETQRPNAIKVVMIPNVRIQDSVVAIVDAYHALDKSKFYLHGLLIDLRDKGNLLAGLHLLEVIKQDPSPDLSGCECIVYTSKYPEVDVASIKAAGAKDVMLRDATKESPLDFVGRILPAFGL